MRFLALIHSDFSDFRDNVDDFIAANRFSDLLVKVNLDESESVSTSKAAVEVGAPSASARPSDYPDGTKNFLHVRRCGSLAPYVGIREKCLLQNHM